MECLIACSRSGSCITRSTKVWRLGTGIGKMVPSQPFWQMHISLQMCCSFPDLCGWEVAQQAAQCLCGKHSMAAIVG